MTKKPKVRIIQIMLSIFLSTAMIGLPVFTTYGVMTQGLTPLTITFIVLSVVDLITIVDIIYSDMTTSDEINDDVCTK